MKKLFLALFAIAALWTYAADITYPLEGNLNLRSGTIEIWFYPMRDMYNEPENGKYEGIFTFFDLNIPEAFNANCSWYTQPGQHGLKVSMGSPLMKKGILPLLGKAPAGWQKGDLHHIAFTWELNQMYLYGDGQRTGQRKQLIQLTGNLGGQKIIFGNNKRNSTYIIKAIRISDSARSGEQLANAKPEPDAATLLFDDFSNLDSKNQRTIPTVIASFNGKQSYGTLGQNCKMTTKGLSLYNSDKMR